MGEGGGGMGGGGLSFSLAGWKNLCPGVGFRFVVQLSTPPTPCEGEEEVEGGVPG